MYTNTWIDTRKSIHWYPLCIQSLHQTIKFACNPREAGLGKHCVKRKQCIEQATSVTRNKVFCPTRNFNPFHKREILDSSKLKEFADDNFKLDDNGSKFSNWVENTVGKVEIAHNEQFLLFQQCFQKTFTADTLKSGHVWKRVNVMVSISNFQFTDTI